MKIKKLICNAICQILASLIIAHHTTWDIGLAVFFIIEVLDTNDYKIS